MSHLALLVNPTSVGFFCPERSEGHPERSPAMRDESKDLSLRDLLQSFFIDSIANYQYDVFTVNSVHLFIQARTGQRTEVQDGSKTVLQTFG